MGSEKGKGKGDPMKVRVVTYRRDVCYGNILWTKRCPMRYGKFPKDHPCADTPEPYIFGSPLIMNGSALDNFRRLGYWASCFPEGDGITYEPLNNQSEEQQINDIKRAFDVWKVK